MQRKKKTSADEKGTLKRIGGYLHRIIPVADASGKILSYTLKPVMVEFRPRDLLQIIVGASILAVPVAFTEETWMLGGELPLKNVLFLKRSVASVYRLIRLFQFLPLYVQRPCFRIYQTCTGNLYLFPAGGGNITDDHPALPLGDR
ncbi:MAG: hypothetical protein U5N56_13450 [Candidatus Marinimicrobia bacterium]|nr:hypothetical protein [Candidatus Neomarinimicrobiota bacterium]